MTSESVFTATPESPADELLRNLTQGNPQLQALMQMMQSQQEAEEEGPSRAELISHNQKLLRSLKKAKKEIQRLQAEMNTLEEECGFFLEINDEIASAVGACGECWGEIPDCPECQGQGQPGAFSPDRNAFELLVSPALRKATWLRPRTPPSATSPNPKQ